MIDIQKLVLLRKELHTYPETAGQEKSTAERIRRYISSSGPDEIISNIGGNGIAFIFKGKERGKKILFRADLDALPIKEVNEVNHKSVFTDKAHLCGHDGHMTILAGLADMLNASRPIKGEVILLFQPAEETGEGASLVLNDHSFQKSINPDYVFALHNLPGYPAGSVITNDEIFSSASVGLTIRLHGKSSHAAEPSKGNSPVRALSRIIDSIHDNQARKKDYTDFVLGTIVHIHLGEKRFGTSPEYGEISCTLRAYRDDDMDILKKKVIESAETICKEENIRYEYNWTEEFLSLENDGYSNKVIKQSASDLGLEITEMENPFRWSEDFSHFTKKYKGAMFGLGSGVDQPALHNPDYDFPDEILEKGINMFYSIYKRINK